jgi:hypothetical protein
MVSPPRGVGKPSQFAGQWLTVQSCRFGEITGGEAGVALPTLVARRVAHPEATDEQASGQVEPVLFVEHLRALLSSHGPSPIRKVSGCQSGRLTMLVLHDLALHRVPEVVTAAGYIGTGIVQTVG